MLRASAIVAATFVLSSTPMCDAGDDTPLTIGDPAPAFDIEHWVKGDTIAEFEADKVYVLEFWATWCAPCVAAMPHLSELQKKYKDYDVAFIGISDEPLETVEKFLKQKYRGDKKLHDERVQYRLTTDPDKSIWKDYFYAAGRSGIPCTFIIGKTGAIEYIGHPMMMDEALDDVVRDEWDRTAFKKTYDAEMKLTHLMNTARSAQRDENWDEAVTALEKVLKHKPDDGAAQFNLIQIQLVKLKAYDSAYAHVSKFIKNNWQDPNQLNAIAWMIADTEGIEHRDLKLAMKATSQSNELTDHEEPAFLDTLARVYYEQGDLAQALEWQEKAAKRSGDDAMGRGIREVLEQYRKEAK